MSKATFRQRVRYAFDNTMAKGTRALVGWLAVVAAVVILLFSLVVLLAGIAPEYAEGGKAGFLRQIFNTFVHTLDSGAIGGDAGGWVFLVLMVLVTVVGLFIVSALIGVIATGLDNKLQDLSKGRSFVVETGHTLILGWSGSIFAVLNELAIANESLRKPVIVVLADRDRVEMEDAIRDKCALGKTRVVCRTGSPIDLADLALVNPLAARSIIVLSSVSEDPDAGVIKTILALVHGPDRRPEPYHIVAEIQRASNLEAARLVGGDEAVLIEKAETIARLVVQASRQSGISLVYTELLDFGGDEIYFREDPAWVGRSFGEALFAYESCTVMGVKSDGAARLNPPADLRIGAGDQLIAIAEDDSVLAAAAPFTGRVDESAIVTAPAVLPEPQRFLILGWNSRSAAVIRELDNYAAPGSEVLVVADSAGVDGAVEAQAPTLANLTASFRAASTTDRRGLDSIGVGSFGHVIVMCYSDELGQQEADARTLVTLLHLRDIASKAGARFSIVSEILDDRNRELAQVTRVDDVIVSEKVISLMLAQISENRDLAPVLADLFDADGSEIYLKEAERYIEPGRETTFATVIEAARRRGEVAIGYRRAAAAADAAAGFGVRLNLPKSTPITAEPGDRVILLAED